jgi:hypothetical protein
MADDNKASSTAWQGQASERSADSVEPGWSHRSVRRTDG